MGVPDFLVAGAARSGTTMLCRVLDRHPSVAICDPKEPHFLAYGGTPLRHRGPGDERTMNQAAITDEAAWRRLFADDGRRWGDGSVTTFHEHERSIPAIIRQCPEARIVVVLREPAERAFSAHAFLSSRGFETLGFEAALAAEPDRTAQDYQHLWRYAAESRYGEALAAFRSSFPADQLHVLFYEDLIDRPADTLAALHRFLDLDPTAETLTLGDKVNFSGTYRSAVVAGVMRRAAEGPGAGFVRALVPLSARDAVRRRLVRATAMTPDQRRAAESAIGPLDGLAVDGPAPDWVRGWPSRPRGGASAPTR